MTPLTKRDNFYFAVAAIALCACIAVATVMGVCGK